jgi:hypothetical protein
MHSVYTSPHSPVHGSFGGEGSSVGRGRWPCTANPHSPPMPSASMPWRNSEIHCGLQSLNKRPGAGWIRHEGGPSIFENSDISICCAFRLFRFRPGLRRGQLPSAVVWADSTNPKTEKRLVFPSPRNPLASNLNRTSRLRCRGFLAKYSVTLHFRGDIFLRRTPSHTEVS